MRSLRHKIALFLGLSSLLPLLAGVMLCMRIYERVVRDQSAKELTSVSRSIPGTVATLQNDMLGLCRTLSKSEDIIDPIQRRDSWLLMANLARFLTANHFDFAEVTRPNGEVILNLVDTTAVGRPSSNPLVKMTLADVGESGLLRNHDEAFVAAACQILSDGLSIGTLTLGKSLDQDFLYKLGRGQGELLTLWKDPLQNSLVLPGKAALPPISAILSKEEWAEIYSGEFVTKTFKSRRDNLQATFFALRDLDGATCVYFAAYRSINYLLEAGLATRIQLLAASSLLIIFMMLFAWWMSKRICEPLTQLSAAAKRMAALDFTERIPASGHDEVAMLAESFNYLATELHKNISQKDQYATELADLNANLERIVSLRTEELVNANLRLKNAIAEKEEFLRAVSHDLSAPLRNIAGLAHLLEQKHSESLNGDARDKLARISSNVKHELQMIEQLLEISRIKSQRGRSTLVDLQELLAQIRNDLSFSLEEKGIKMIVPGILPVIYAERNRVRQLFQNLIDNAIKYIGDQPRPRIEIGWSEEEKIHLFWISDNGMGIPPDQKDKIFGIFRRVTNKEAAAIEGKGVGLAVVKTIVELLGGEIWVESKLGEGSTFYFTMDRALVSPETQPEGAPDREDERMALLV